MEKMTDLQKEINESYNLISAFHVAGDNVEVMAAAREHLRLAYKLAAPEKEVAESDG